MKDVWTLIKEVLKPGNPEFRAHMARVQEEERRLLRCLQILDDPVTKQINASSDEAAEF